MIRALIPRLRRALDEDGQALVLFAVGLVATIGLVGLSVDVGRYLWARTQIQSAVDAAALAGAQEMPLGTTQAAAQATAYWNKNNGSLVSNTSNLTMTPSYPPGNRAIQVDASADISTWFARVIGVTSMHVSASSTAASSVLDIAMVVDTSGSLCWGSYPPADEQSPTGSFGPKLAPGRTADQVKLSAAITTATTNIPVYSSTNFNSVSTAVNAKFGFGNNISTQYWKYKPYGNGSISRAGLIKIDNELMVITAVPNSTTLTVTRAQYDNFAGHATTAVAHAKDAVIYSQHDQCIDSPPAATGPYDPYDGMMTDAQYFTTLFNSTYDKIGFASFSDQGTLETNLTSTYSTVTNAMTAIANPDGGTNTAHGIAVGRQILDGAGARANAVRVLVILTDGRANSWCTQSYNASNYNNTTCNNQGGGLDGNSDAVTAANSEAARVHADKNTVVYTIGFGPYVDDNFLQTMATANGGKYYKAPTLADLQAAFASVAQSTHIMITR